MYENNHPFGAFICSYLSPLYFTTSQYLRPNRTRRPNAPHLSAEQLGQPADRLRRSIAQKATRPRFGVFAVKPMAVEASSIVAVENGLEPKTRVKEFATD